MILKNDSQVYFDAMEVNGALKKNFKPTSADHDGASFGAFDIIALPFQLSANAAFWWMNDSSLLGRMSGLQYFESQAPQIEPSYTDYKTKTVLVSSTAAFDYGHNDGRSWVGSNGANA